MTNIQGIFLILALANPCGGGKDTDTGSTDTGSTDTGSYTDSDGDGYGSGINGDCNDHDAAINPGAIEVCDEVDNDCDGGENDNNQTWYLDSDGDGYGDPNRLIESCTEPTDLPFVLDGTDCDDDNADINPGADEICDGVDNNCNGVIDDCTD